MIRFIAAIDSKLGMANDSRIPWQGKVPSDVAYFRDKTLGGVILIGYGTYKEFTSPLPERTNVVASSTVTALLPGFRLTTDARQFLLSTNDDVWVIGGPSLFSQTLDLASELYLTRIEGDFGCTKFFPKFNDKFEKRSSTEPITENGISLHFEIWQLK